jgi:hypothetical protein
MTGQRQRDLERTVQFPVLLRDRRLGFIEVRENSGAALIEALAAVGQVQAARRSPEQLHAQPLLQSRHATAYGRLRRVQSRSRCGKAAGLDHGHERLQIFESIHIVALKRTVLFLLCCLFLPSQ